MSPRVDAATIARAGISVPADAVIAIDGPAGSGKSTTAKALAQRFGLIYVDSGAMYRALTLAALRAKVSPRDSEALTRLLATAQLELQPGRQESRVHWNGQDVSAAIRAPEVDEIVSAVSSHGSVRRAMVHRQRALGRRGGVVMEGRDIGSVVFPLATTKIFLDASLDARVTRRFRQFRERGQEVDRDQLERELAERDRSDSERDESPLTVSPDAFVLDSSDWSLSKQIDEAAAVCLVNPYLDTQLDTDPAAAWRTCPWRYQLAYRLFNVAARFYDLRQVGYEGRVVPRGVVIACNHIHWYDPPLIGSTFCRAPVRTLAKEELFVGPLRPFFKWIDVIPIKRKGYDRRAFATAREGLRRGDNVFIFPEGTRRPIGQPGPVRNGLGILVQETRADIQPMFIRGTRALRPGGSLDSPLEVRFGPVLRMHALDHLRTLYNRREVSRRIGDLMQATFEELQARSFADRPETEFERETGRKLRAQLDAKSKRVFGSPQ